MLIDPAAYWQDAWLEREYERIFSRRYFAGSSHQLQADDDYLAYRVCGRPRVTRRQAGQLATFDNVCLHRANLIDPEGQGNRPFRCAYHGWQYDSAGELRRAPMSNPACITRHQLATHTTLERDGLVFVQGDQNGQPAPSTAPGADALQAIGFQHGELFHHEALVHEANWKLLVENVIEGYHLSFVHQDSFVPTGISSASETIGGDAGADSWVRVLNRRPEPEGKRGIAGANGDYVHAYIFPNLFISITGGLVGFISHFKPNAPGQTTLEWMLFETPLLMAQRGAVRQYVRDKAISFTRQVLSEDLVVLENSQRGVRHASGPHQLQDNEARVRHFHQTYHDWMS